MPGDSQAMEELRRMDFEKHLGDTFRVETESEETVDLVLVETTEIGSERSYTKRAEPFAVEFRGPSDLLLEQGTRELVHEHLGTMELFIVPVGPDDEGIRYEAVFN